MKSFKENWKYILGLCIIPALILYGIWRSYQIKYYARYTIATTTRRLITAKNGPEIEYIYNVNGKAYTSYGYDVEKYHINILMHGICKIILTKIPVPVKSSGACLCLIQ